MCCNRGRGKGEEGLKVREKKESGHARAAPLSFLCTHQTLLAWEEEFGVCCNRGRGKGEEGLKVRERIERWAC